MSRGRESQVFAANYLKPVFPDAESLAASLPGKDIKNTGEWAFEVKARRAFNPAEWSRQASKYDDGKWHACIMRPDGYGEAKVGQWLVFMTFEEFRTLLNLEVNDEQESNDDGRASCGWDGCECDSV